MGMKNLFDRVVDQVGSVILGKEEQIRLALTCLFAGGHLLIEDIPGIGKTTLAQSLARSLGLEFQRVQFTSDLLPGDILGVSVFEKESENFVFHKGPIFTQVLLADEINRATPKTQSALLEAMEERQVTVEGQTRPLAAPFFVIATQNPIEQSGTFNLPDSQLDRFLVRLDLGYPEPEAEMRLLARGDAKAMIPDLAPVLGLEDIADAQARVEKVHASQALLKYVLDVVEFTRISPEVYVGLSPRAGLGLLKAAKARAFLDDRDHVLPEDVQDMLPRVVGHRLRRADDLRGFTPAELDSLLRMTAIP